MVYCVQAYVILGTAKQRDNAVAAIEGGRSGKARWGVDILRTDDQPWGTQGFALYTELRFVSEADADDLWTSLVTFLGKTNPRAGTWLELHTCTHDEGTDVCTVTNRQDW